VVTQSRNHDFARMSAALTTIEGGLLVLIAGRLSTDQAREIAAARREGRQGIALLLATSTWASIPDRAGDRQPGTILAESLNGGPDAESGAVTSSAKPGGNGAAAPDRAPAETAAAEAVLRAAGWRVTSVDATTPLAVAWQRLPRLGSYAAFGGTLPTVGVVTR
jgi:hypothetical protein